ncbi:unnamed protein product [Darwinula stevensoni]|uniref:Nuclear pore complex protein n=1 Tax=Darwinula stevensoni TaxID=69355 RepID=A0A7R8ZZ17_9CRUS|nr:unnamed protein product [Darwinula stevensoni]CAG0881648.1 unnamed protein product [Darwinula stevensoni]
MQYLQVLPSEKVFIPMEAFDAYEAWRKHFHVDKPVKPVGVDTANNMIMQARYEREFKDYEEQLSAWNRSMTWFFKNAVEKLKGIVMRPNAWLKLGCSVEDDSTTQAHSQLRQMYIPQATFLLMDVLSKTGRSGDALRICNWIASPRHSVHKVRVVYMTGETKIMSETVEKENPNGGFRDMFSEYPHPFPVVKETWEVPTKDFLEASSGIISIIDALGKIFYMVRSDINKNISDLKVYYEQDKEKFSTLKAIVESEGSVHGSGTTSLLWLKRGLELTCTFLRYLLEDYDSGMLSNGISDIMRRAYTETLQKHHPWIVKNLVSMLLSALPNRHGVITKLTYGADGPEAEKLLMENLRTWLANFSSCLHEVSDMYISKGLES